MSDPGPLHLRPSAPLADRVLLPGDPHRALAVAQDLLEEPKMFNHARGLWGYTGKAPDGELLTIQATGMGGPSAAIVIEELIDLGARTLVRIGTCGSLDHALELGDLVAGQEVIAGDGTSVALGGSPTLTADRRITDALIAAGATAATVVSTDLFYDPRERAMADWTAAGAGVVEMEAATLLALADRRQVAAGVVLAVTDLLAEGPRRRISTEGLQAAGLALGQVAWSAVSTLGSA